MKTNKTRFFTAVFCAVMFLFSLFMLVIIPLRSYQRFQTADLELSLETSQGRERKQQYEYDEVTVALPAAREKLQELQPLADEAKALKNELKERRKALREEKAALEKQLEELQQHAVSSGTAYKTDAEGND